MAKASQISKKSKEVKKLILMYQKRVQLLYMKVENEYAFSATLRLISGVMLILAIGIHPSSYYLILRWFVAGSSLYSGWVMSQLKKSNWAWALFIIGVLFNPVLPVYLDRSTWQIIDIITIVILFTSLSVNKRNYEENI